MEKKKDYERAEFEIVLLDVPDIITSSTLGGDNNSSEDDYGWTKPGGSWS